MTPIPQDLLLHLEKTGIQSYIPLSTPHASGSKSNSWAIMAEALLRISEVLSSHDDKTALKLVIRDMGGLDWGYPSSAVSRHSHD